MSRTPYCTPVESLWAPPVEVSAGPHCPDCVPPALLRPVTRGKRVGQHRCPDCEQYWLVAEALPGSACWQITEPPEGTL